MSLALPPNLPTVSSARLPQLYESARSALAECARIDECKDWADKMAAMASYAKQAKDEELEKAARRIRARAIDQCGKLLKSIPKEPGKRTDQPRADEGPRSSPRQEAARAAGMSPREVKQAIRVNNVPREEFERVVESPEPPTVTELAERGKRPPKPLVDLKGRDPKDFKLATAVQGHLRELALFIERADPIAAVRGSSNRERRIMRDQAALIGAWLTRLRKEIDK